MTVLKKITIINGSASDNSANHKLIQHFINVTKAYFHIMYVADLKILPHFNPQRSDHNTPAEILTLRKSIANADGVVICSPEYIFSIPSGLKNILEWCVSTTVFTNKPLGIITASAHGEKAHEELQLIMRTLQAKFTPETTLLIPGIKGKINENGQLMDDETKHRMDQFIKSFNLLVTEIKTPVL